MSEFAFAGVKGGSVYIDDKLGAGVDLRRYGPRGIPYVLADVHPDSHAADNVDGPFVALYEVAVLIKNTVVG